MRKISDSDKKYLLGLKPEDINFDLLISLLGDKEKKQGDKRSVFLSKLKQSDMIELTANEYFNKTKVTTNVGLFIYNKFIVEPHFKEVLGYVNYVIDNNGLKKLEGELASALLNDKITQDMFVEYLDKTQWLSMKLHSVLSGSFTMNTIKPSPKVMAERDKLFKDNKEKLDNKDLIVAVNIEKQVTKSAYDQLQNDPGLNLYKSGARGTFDNNFKNICVMKGPVFNPVNNDYDIVKNNFIEGINKEDIAVHGNLIVTGSYPKSFGTL
jgi:hypothetical protein